MKTNNVSTIFVFLHRGMVSQSANDSVGYVLRERFRVSRSHPFSLQLGESEAASSNSHSLVLDFDWANSNVLVHEDSLVISHYPFRLQRNPSSSLAFCDLHIIDNDEDAVVVANDLWFFLVHISPPMKVCEL